MGKHQRILKKEKTSEFWVVLLFLKTPSYPSLQKACKWTFRAAEFVKMKKNLKCHVLS